MVLFCVGFDVVMFSCVNVRGLVLSCFGLFCVRFDVVMFCYVNVRGLVLSRFWFCFVLGLMLSCSVVLMLEV